MAEIIVKPFDWNDNMSEIAQEDFSLIQKSLSYYRTEHYMTT